MKSEYTKSTLLGLLAIILIVGCQLEETDELPSGSIAVSAFDSTGVEIIGGEIFLDGATSNQFTPDTLNNVLLGPHTIAIEAPGFIESELSVEVFKHETSTLQFEMEYAPFGGLEVTSTPAGATIVIDQLSMIEVTPFTFAAVDSGLREITVFLDGYKTINPPLFSANVTPLDTALATFELEPGTTGGNEGDIAIDFTLEDDFGNMVSLHNYRGQIILLTFFFKLCSGCNEEFPEIQDIYEDYLAYGVQIIGIDPMNFGEGLEDVQFVRETHGLTFKLVMDWGSIYCGPDHYQIPQYPTNIIIDQTGEIHTRIDTRRTSYDELAEIFDSLLGL